MSKKFLEGGENIDAQNIDLSGVDVDVNAVDVPMTPEPSVVAEAGMSLNDAVLPSNTPSISVTDTKQELNVLPTQSDPGPSQVNFDPAFLDLTSFNFETFDDAVNIAVENAPNLEMNEPFFDMLESAAVDLNRFPTMAPMGNINSPVPSDGANIFRSNSNVPNLSTPNGRRAFLAGSVETAKQLTNDQAPGYQDPFFFGAKRFEMDRYYKHPRFSDLGFNPFSNNESYYNLNSSKWDNFKRSSGAFASMFGPAFTSGWRSIGDLFTGDVLQGDYVGARAMEDAMRIGRSSSGGVRGFFNDLYVNSAYTMGIISSIALEELALFAIAGSQGGLNPAADAALLARSAQNFNRFRKLFSLKSYSSAAQTMLSALKNIDNAKAFWSAARGGSRGVASSIGNFLTPELLKQIQLLRTSKAAGMNITNIAKANALFGGAYMDFRAANLAWSESKMEGGLVENELKEQLYMDVQSNNGGLDPTLTQLEEIGADARAAGFTTTMINAPIIFLSNKLVLNTALRGMRGAAGRLYRSSLSGTAGRIAKNPKAVKDHFYDIGSNKFLETFGLDIFRKLYKAGTKGSLRHLGATAMAYSTANFAEGFQELAQEATAAGVKDYYTALYDQEIASALDVKLADMEDSHEAGMREMKGGARVSDGISVKEAFDRGVSSQMSGQGLHTFLSGFMMGGLIQGPQTLMFEVAPNLGMAIKDKIKGTDDYEQYRKGKDETIKRTVEVLNRVYADPQKYFDPKKVNLLLQKELNTRMVGSTYADNNYEFINDRDHSIFNHIYTVMQSGQLAEFRDQIESFQKLDNKSLKEAFPDITGSAAKLRTRAQAMLNKMNEMENAYNTFDEKFVNPFDRKKFKKGTKEYNEEVIREAAFNHAKMMAMFSKDAFEQSIIRTNKIVKALTNDPLFESVDASDITVLLGYSTMRKEISQLKDEIKLPAESAELKEIQEKKKKKLELLEKFYNIVTDKKNQTKTGGGIVTRLQGVDKKTGETVDVKLNEEGVFNRSRLKASGVREAFVNYVNFLAGENNDFVKSGKVDETLRMVLDYGQLKSRASDYIKAFDVLNNPNHLLEISERMAVTMKAAWESHRDKVNLLLKVKEYYKREENIKFIQDLADKNIYPDPDQAKKFLQGGKIPTEYYDEDGLITQSTDSYKFDLIETLQKDLLNKQSDRTASEQEDNVTDTTLEEKPTDVTERTGDIGTDEIELNKTLDELDEVGVAPPKETAKEKDIYQKFIEEEQGTQDILKRAYDKYVAVRTAQNMTSESIGVWSTMASGGAPLVRARYELFQMYNKLTSEEKQDKTFEQWIASNSRNPLINGAGGILDKHQISFSDISLLATDTFESKLKPGENSTPAMQDSKAGINIVSYTIYDREGGSTTGYTLRDNDNKPIFDKYGFTDQNNQGILRAYPSETAAAAARDKIKKNFPTNLSDITFNEETFAVGEIVEDNKGNTYAVKNIAEQKNGKRIYLVASNETKKNLKKPVNSLSEKQWKSQGWKRSLQTPNIVLSLSRLTRLNSSDPIRLYPFNGTKVNDDSIFAGYKQSETRNLAQIKKDFQEQLKEISQSEKGNVEIVIERNPEYQNVKSKEKEAAKNEDYDQFPALYDTTGKKYDINKEIKRSANEFDVTIMINRKPFAKLTGFEAKTFVDLNGDVIYPEEITKEQAERLFITGGKKDEYLKIRRRYKNARILNDKLRDLIGKKDNVTIKLSELDDINFNISSGQIAFPTKEQGDTPFAQLDYKTFDGEIVIFDFSKQYDADGGPVLIRENIITTIKDQKQRLAVLDEIDQAVGTYKVPGKSNQYYKDVAQLKMGRYVQAIKLPNGTITFVELKPESLSKDDASDIAQRFVDQQQKALQTNYTDGKRGKKDANFKEDTDKFSTAATSKKFNDDIQTEFYIQGARPGLTISIGVSKFAKIKMEVFDRLVNETYVIDLTEDAFSQVKDLNIDTFAKILTDNFNQKYFDNVLGSDGARLNITAEDFVTNIPSDVTAKELTGSVRARIRPEIRKNITATLTVAGNTGTYNTTKGSFDATATEQAPEQEVSNETVEEVEVLDAETFRRIQKDGYTSIPQSILDEIALKKGAGTELTKLELKLDEILREQGREILPAETSDDAASQTNSDNQTAAQRTRQQKIAEYNKLKAEYDKAYDQKFDDLTNKYESEGLSKRDVNKNVLRDIGSDPQLKELEDRLEQVRQDASGLGDTALSVRDNFDGLDVENINTFIDWLRNNLPDFILVKDIEDLGKRLKNNGITAGAFTMELGKLVNGMPGPIGKIFVGKLNPDKYHEAFHAVYRMLLSEQEIAQYLSIAGKEYRNVLKAEGKTLQQAIDDLRITSPIYENMSDQQLEERLYEEYMADEFQKFKMSPKSTGIAAAIKSFFNRLLEIIRTIFTKYNQTDLDLLFRNIDSGAFKTRDIQNNRFTESYLVDQSTVDQALGVPSVPTSYAFSIRKGQPIVKTIKTANGKTRDVFVNQYFSAEETGIIRAHVGGLYLQKLKEAAADSNYKGEYNPNAILQDAIDDFVFLYSPNNDRFLDLEAKELKKISKPLQEFHRNLIKSQVDIRKEVKDYLDAFDISFDNSTENFEQQDFTAEGIVKAADQWDSEANQIGGFRSLSASIRKFIATTVVDTVDQFGVDVVQPVDYAKAYNGLLKTIAGTTNVYDILYKMEIFAETNMHTAAVVDNIMQEIGIDKTPQQILQREFVLNDEIQNAKFFQSIIKGFTQFRIDYIFQKNDPDTGLSTMFAANHKDDANSQTTVWQEHYSTLFRGLSQDKAKRREAVNTLISLRDQLQLKQGAELSISSLSTTADNLAIDIYNQIGIELSGGYILYSMLRNMQTNSFDQENYLKMYENVEEIRVEDVNEMITSLNNHKFVDGQYGADLFANMDNMIPEADQKEDDQGIVEAGTGDVKNRIKRMARGNSVFDESVGNTVFRDPEGNLIYAHQLPTYHLERMSELNSLSEIERLKTEDPFLRANYLLNSPRFKAMAEQKKLAVIRIIGSKLSSLQVDETTNEIKSRRSLKSGNDKGVSFGDSSPAEFISNLINSYIYNYNGATGKTTTTEYEIPGEFESDSPRQDIFTTAPVDIKVISESNTGDLVSLPIIPAVTDANELSDIYLRALVKEVENEYNRIKREVNQEEGYTEERTLGYNDFLFDERDIQDVNDRGERTPSVDRAAKLNKMGEYLTLRSKIKEQLRVLESLRSFGKIESQKVESDGINMIVKPRTGKGQTFVEQNNLTRGKSVQIDIGDTKFSVTYEGAKSIHNLVFDDVLEDLGSDVSETKSAVNKNEVTGLDGNTYYTRTKTLANFLRGNPRNPESATKYDIVKFEKVDTDAQVTVLEDGNVKVATVDTTFRDVLEKAARAGEDFNSALMLAGEQTNFTITGILRQRMMDEFSEFEEVLKELAVMKKINPQIKKGLTDNKGRYGKNNPSVDASMNLFNLRRDDETHNLMQIFFNDKLNTLSINQILLGDVAMTIKDVVDEVKRAKMQNAAGPSAESIISSPIDGVMHPVKHISQFLIEDPLYKTKYVTSKTTGDKADAQAYVTVKGARYLDFGFGQLNEAKVNLYNRIEKGERITRDQFFGSKENDTNGYLKENAVINSKKLVYGDGKVFNKMSVTTLTPAFTTYQTGPLAGQARKGMEELHNLRLKMERHETEGPINETLSFAITESGSKMLKQNPISLRDLADPDFAITEDNITGLQAKYMRFQQFVPSNKTENIDPTQMKALITSEQDDNVMVTIGNKEISLGDVRRLYNKTVGERVRLKYTDRRNLIFNFATAQRELRRSISQGAVTLELESFLDYAVEALKASQNTGQFVELFTAKGGIQNYDLNNPITIQRFQELFMSFFTKGVLSEKQPGVSVALQSNWGTKVIKKVVALDPQTKQPSRWEVIRQDAYEKNPFDIQHEQYANEDERTFAVEGSNAIKVGDYYIDDLRHDVAEFDENGKATGKTYTEFIMPPHFPELMNIKPGDAIPDFLTQAFGIRIPSQDKHSSVNLKLVDFMPVEYGSSAVFAHELVEISGADFDIDKLYMMIKEFYSKETIKINNLNAGLLLPIGISGSGKSTFINKLVADNENVVVVSPDEIRRQITGDVSDQSQNAEVFRLAKERAAQEINAGNFVVFDATNTIPRFRNQLIEEIKELSGKKFDAYYKVFEVNPEVAKGRIAKAIRSGQDRSKVPDDVIDRQFKQFEEGKNNTGNMISFDEIDFVTTDTQFFEYGKTNNKTELYEEYLQYQKAQLEKPGSTIQRAYKKWQKKGSILDQKDETRELLKSSEDIELEWAEWSAGFRNENAPKKKTLTDLSELEFLNFDANKSRLNFAISKGYWYNKKSGKFNNLYKVEPVISDRALLGTLRELKLPVTQEEFNEYIGNYDSKLDSWDRMPYVGYQNNKILDYRLALQSNDGMTKPRNNRDFGIAYEPAVLDPLMSIVEEIQNDLPALFEKTREDGVIIENMLGKIKAWQNNKAGAGAIGAAVLPNIVLNLLKEYNVKVRSANEAGVPIINLEIDGVVYDQFSDYVVDTEKSTLNNKVYKTNGDRTQFVISALITAMTDNAKERLAAKLGLSRKSLGVVTNLVALGMNVNTAVFLVNQPGIRKSYFLAENKEDQFDPGVRKLVENRITELNEVYEPIDTDFKTKVNIAKITTEDLKEQINLDQLNIDPKEKTIDDAVKEVAILEMFIQAHDLSETTRKMQSLVQTTSGLSQDIVAFDARTEDANELGIELNNKEFNESTIPLDVRRIFRGQSYMADYYSITKELDAIFGQTFVTRTKAFRKVENLILNNFDPFSLSDVQLKKIQRDIISYFTTKAYINHIRKTGQDELKGTTLSNNLIYDEFSKPDEKITTIVSKLREYTRDQGGNYFVDTLLAIDTTNDGTNKTGINRILKNTWNKLSDDQKNDATNAILDLYQDPNTIKDLYSIINYLIVKDGLQYGPNSFLDLLPAPLLEEILYSSAQVNSLFKKTDPTDANFEDVFGMGNTFNVLAEEFVFGYLSSRKNAYYLNKIKSSPVDPLENVSKYQTRVTVTLDEASTLEENETAILSKGNTLITDNIKQLLSPTGRSRDPFEEIGQYKLSLYKSGTLEEVGGAEAILKDLGFSDISEVGSSDLKAFLTKEEQTDSEGNKTLRKEKYYFYKASKATGEQITKAKENVEKKKKAAAKKASIRPIRLNNDTGEIIIDMYMGVGELDFAKMLRGRNRKLAKKLKRKYIPVTDAQIDRAITKRIYQNRDEILEVMGKRFNRGGAISLPPILSFVEISYDNQRNINYNYRYFKLENFTSQRNFDLEIDEVFDMTEGTPDEIVGTAARYKEIQLEGSLDQNPAIGLIKDLGKRSTYQYILDQNEAKKSSKEKDVYGLSDIDLDQNFDYNSNPNSKPENHYGVETNIDATDKEINVTDSENKEINTAEIEKMSNDNIDPHSAIDQEQQDQAPDPGNFAMPAGRGVPLSRFKKDDALDESSSAPADNVQELTDEWNNLSKLQRGQIKKDYDINSLEELIEEYNHPTNSSLSVTEFMEQLFSCK